MMDKEKFWQYQDITHSIIYMPIRPIDFDS